MNTSLHYHLWLKPSGALYLALLNLMEELRRAYRGPVFDPHVTLLGEMKGDEQEFCEKAETLARNLHCLEIRLNSSAHQRDYFHCLYFTVDNTPALMDAHQRAGQIFGCVPRSPFHPHVSLLYGLFPLRVKEHILHSLPRELPQTGVANEMTLIRAGSTNPKDWHPVLTCRLLEHNEGKPG